MEQYNVDSQDSFIMKFKRLYNNAQKRASKFKHEHGLGKVMSEEMLQELNQ